MVIEVFYGVYGCYEINVLVWIFILIMINDEFFIVVVYICILLVKFFLVSFNEGGKFCGMIVVEFGNCNILFDMFVYEWEGKEYIFMVNMVWGMMKISMEEIGCMDGIEEWISGMVG